MDITEKRQRPHRLTNDYDGVVEAIDSLSSRQHQKKKNEAQVTNFSHTNQAEKLANSLVMVLTIISSEEQGKYEDE